MNGEPHDLHTDQRTLPTLPNVVPAFFVGLAFALLGSMFGVWHMLLTDLQASLGISAGQLGQAITISIVAALPMMLLGGYLTDWLGVHSMISLGALLTGGALLLMSRVSTYGVLIVLLIPFAMGVGVLDVSINAAAIGFERATTKRFMPYFHAAYSGFSGFAAVLTGVLLHWGIPFRSFYLVTAFTLLGFAVVSQASGVMTARNKTPASPHLAARDFTSLRHPTVLLVGLVIALCFFAEGTLENWSAIYLRASLQLPAFLGGSGVAFYHFAMLLGRLLAAQALKRLTRRSILLSTGVFTALGMTVSLSTEFVPLILAGFLIVGLSLAMVVPMCVSLAGDLFTLRTGEIMSVLMLLGYGGFLVGPLVIGNLTDLVGLRVALVSVVAAGLLMTIVVAHVPQAET